PTMVFVVKPSEGPRGVLAYFSKRLNAESLRKTPEGYQRAADGMLEKEVSLPGGAVSTVPVVLNGVAASSGVTWRKACYLQFHCGVFGAHRSAEKTYALMKRVVWWATMKEDINSWVGKCLTCFKGAHRPLGDLLAVVEYCIDTTPGPHGYTPRDLDRAWSLGVPLEKDLLKSTLEFEPVSDWARKIFGQYKAVSKVVKDHLTSASEARVRLANRYRREVDLKVGDRVVWRAPGLSDPGAKGQVPWKKGLTGPWQLMPKSVSGREPLELRLRDPRRPIAPPASTATATASGRGTDPPADWKGLIDKTALLAAAVGSAAVPEEDDESAPPPLPDRRPDMWWWRSAVEAEEQEPIKESVRAGGTGESCGETEGHSAMEDEDVFRQFSRKPKKRGGRRHPGKGDRKKRSRKKVRRQRWADQPLTGGVASTIGAVDSALALKVFQTVDKIHTAYNAEKYDNSDSAFFSNYLALLGTMQNQVFFSQKQNEKFVSWIKLAVDGSGKLVHLLDKALETENEKLRLQERSGEPEKDREMWEHDGLCACGKRTYVFSRKGKNAKNEEILKNWSSGLRQSTLGSLPKSGSGGAKWTVKMPGKGGILMKGVSKEMSARFNCLIGLIGVPVEVVAWNDGDGQTSVGHRPTMVFVVKPSEGPRGVLAYFSKRLNAESLRKTPEGYQRAADGMLEKEVSLPGGAVSTVPVVLNGVAASSGVTWRKACYLQFHCGVFGAHRSAEKTYALMKRVVWWATMKEDINSWVGKCLTCFKARSRATKVTTKPMKPAADYCWQEVSVDCEGPNKEDYAGNRYSLTYMDCLSHAVYLEPLRALNHAEV
ncbi:unnamed protein product, partial [Effrenium voratum]